jgi:hypothetical protein
MTKAQDKENLEKLEEQQEQPMLDEDSEVRAQAPTHEDLVAAGQQEKAEENVERLVQTRAGDRPVIRSFPPPQTGSYIYVPKELREQVRGRDPETGEPGGDEVDVHKGHAVQVAQVHTYPDAPSTVTLRCDCAREWTVVWTAFYAERTFKVTDNDLAELREVPERFEEESERRNRDQVT